MTDLIAAHLRHLEAGGYAERTIEDRGELLHRLDRDLPMGLEQATVEELAAWLAKPGWSRQTRATYYTHTCGFFRWACDPHNPILDYDPTTSLTRPHVPRGLPDPIDDAELQAALTRADERFRLWWCLAAYAGMRPIEIAQVRREDISEQRILIINSKGGKSRAVPTHPSIWASVKDFPPGPIVRNTYGKAVGAAYVSGRMKRQRELHPELERCTARRSRHWFGTNTLRTSNLRVTQELMGHASPATTAIYTLVTNEERAAAIHALPTFVAPTPR